MTSETQIEAGRELDTLVATEVMGLTVMRPDDICPQCGHPCRGHQSGDFCRSCMMEPGPLGRCGSYDWDYARQYSTSYEGCGLVLERMQALGWAWSLENLLDNDREWRDWRASVSKMGGQSPIEAESSALPHAVALAAPVRA
jgi:hypothetical protein